MRFLHRQGLYFFILLFAFALPFAKVSYVYAQQSPGEKIIVPHIQRMPDSEIKIDSILAYTLRNRRDSTIEPLILEGLKIARENGFRTAEAKLLDGFGVMKREISDYFQAMTLHKQALEIARSLKHDSIQMVALNNIGVVFRRLDQNNKALNYHMDALRIAERIHNDYSISVALNSIGNIHTALGNYNDAISYFKKSLPIAVKANNKLGMAMNVGNIGECYDHLGQLDSAKKYYTQSLEYNKQLKNEMQKLKGIAICYGSLGNIYKKEGNFNMAHKLFEDGLIINKRLKDKLFIAQSYNFLGDINLRQGNIEASHKMFDSALVIAKNIHSISEIKNAYTGLTKVYSSKKMFKEALEYSDLTRLYSDSIYIENSNKHIKQVEAIYQNESELSKIKLLETTRRNDRVMMIGSLILFALLLITGILYYLRNRLIERNKGLQRELEIRSQIASDLHDDMGSSLSSIHIFSELLRKPGAKSEELLTKIEANAKDTLEALDDIIWLVKPSNDKFSNLSMHISQYAVPLFEGKDIKFKIDFPESISETPLPMETRRNIFLIIKESINNLVKYSNCTEAVVKAENVGDDILFTVKDNGKGFDPEMLTNRNGLKNIRARANQINADIDIQSAPGEGTIIQLLVKARELTGIA